MMPRISSSREVLFSYPLPEYSARLFVPSYSAKNTKNFELLYEPNSYKSLVPSYLTKILNNGPVNKFISTNSSITINNATKAEAVQTVGQSGVQNLAPNFIRYSNKSFKIRDNQDPNPILIKKRSTQPISYTQNISVKFLKPPAAQPDGDIIITQLKDVQLSPLVPKIIRYKPPLTTKPGPKIIRERPPHAPAPILAEHHVIPGKVLPPPPRKIITERLPELPPPPQDIIVERWLEYGPRVRRVVFHPAPKTEQTMKQKNLIVEWSSPDVKLTREFKNLGVTLENPNEYVAKYGPSLVDSSSIPEIARGIRPGDGLVLASESIQTPVRFIGDVSAMKLLRESNAEHFVSSKLNFDIPKHSPSSHVINGKRAK